MEKKKEQERKRERKRKRENEDERKRDTEREREKRVKEMVHGLCKLVLRPSFSSFSLSFVFRSLSHTHGVCNRVLRHMCTSVHSVCNSM